MSTASAGQYRAFICYSSRDKAWADAVCNALELAGHRCWIAPRDVTAGTEWGSAIIGGIDQCQIMVLIFSRHANASTHVRREVERALSKGLSILPLRIEDVQPQGAMEYALSSTQWLDAFAPHPEASLQQLTESVTALLSIPSRSSPSYPDMARTADRFATNSAHIPGPRRAAWLCASFVLVAVCAVMAIWSRTGAPSANTMQPSGQPPRLLDHAPKSTQIVLNGTWNGTSGSVFTMHATLVAEGKRLTGQIRRRLTDIPPDRPDMIDKWNTVGIEEVTGSLDDTELVLAGTSISDSTWMGVGIYRVQLNKESGTFRVSNAEGDAVQGSGIGTYVIVK